MRNKRALSAVNTSESAGVMDLKHEKDLVDNAKSADAEAFGHLYDLYYDKVFGYAYYRVGNRFEAEDITEQVFLKALENISRFEWQGSSFLPWLLKIASNLVADHFRARKHKMVELEGEAKGIRDEACQPEEFAIRESERKEVMQAIQNLTEEQQQVITMRFMVDMTSDEVAKALNKKPGAVRALQHRAMQALSKILGEEYDEAECG